MKGLDVALNLKLDVKAAAIFSPSLVEINIKRLSVCSASPFSAFRSSHKSNSEMKTINLSSAV